MPLVYYNRAHIQYLLKNYKKYKADWDKAYALDPKINRKDRALRDFVPELFNTFSPYKPERVLASGYGDAVIIDHGGKIVYHHTNNLMGFFCSAIGLFFARFSQLACFVL